MEADEIWDATAAEHYDTPGEGMFAPDVLGPTVDRLVALAGGGRVLELAIGTGRVAVPLLLQGPRAQDGFHRDGHEFPGQGPAS